MKKNKKNIITLGLFSSLIIPIFSFAYTPPAQVQTVNDFSYILTNWLTTLLIPLLFGVALVVFLAGILKFVSAGDNEEKRTAGRDTMLFGIIALFVMIAVWGIVRIVYNSFFSETPTLPNYLPSEI